MLQRLIILSFIIFTCPGVLAETNTGNPFIQGKYLQGSSVSAYQWANRGIELFEQGDYQQAINYLYEAWKLNPDETNSYAKNLSVAYSNYASNKSEQGKNLEALNLARQALFFDESNTIAQENLDRLYSNISKQPQDYKFRLEKAREQRSQGKLEQSIAEYRKTESLLQANKKEERELLYTAKLELAQVYQVLYSKYEKSPVKELLFSKLSKLIQELYKLNSKDHRPHSILGWVYLTKKNYSQAIQSFENSIKLNTNNNDAKLGLVRAWKEVVNIAPKEANNLKGYGYALIKAGKPDEGEGYLAKARELNSQDNEIIETPFSKKKLNNQAYYTAHNAYIEYKSKNYHEAIRLYNKALRDMPPSLQKAEIYHALSQTYQAQNNIPTALKIINKSIKLNPSELKYQQKQQEIKSIQDKNRSKLIKKAIKYQKAKHYDKAINLYKQALNDEPENAELYFNLGVVYQERKLIEKAFAQYKKAQALAPENTNYKNAVVSLERAISQGYLKISQSSQALDKAVLAQNSGNTQQAIIYYQEAISLNPDNAQGHFNLATVYHMTDQKQNAINSYSQAYRLDAKNFPEAKYFMATLLEKSHKYPQALRAYRIYLEKHPNSEYSELARQHINLINNSQ